MSQKYWNIRKLKIPEIISNNIFLYKNFRYELLTIKHRAIAERWHKSKQHTKQYAIKEDVLNIIFLIQFDIYFISYKISVFVYYIYCLDLFVFAGRQLDATLADYALYDQPMFFAKENIVWIYECSVNIFGTSYPIYIQIHFLPFI